MTTFAKSRTGVALIALTFLISACAQKNSTGQKPLPLPTVQIIEPSRGNLNDLLAVTGTLTPMPNQEATVIPQVSGTLEQLSVQFGCEVIKNQIIGRISPLTSGTQVAQAEAVLNQSEVQEQQAEANAIEQVAQTKSGILLAAANVRSAQATEAGAEALLTADESALNTASSSLKRERLLFGDGLVSQKDVDDAQLADDIATAQVTVQRKTIDGLNQNIDAQQQQLAAAKTGDIEVVVKRRDIEVARQQVFNARAALAASLVQANLYTLHAPITGEVTSIGANVGETVDSTTKLVTIANLNKFQLTLNVPGNAIAKVEPGQRISLTSDLLPNSATVSAIVTTVSPNFDSATGTVPVLALVDNSSGLLKDDMTVSGNILLSHHQNVLIVPASAVLSDPDTGSKSIGIVDSSNVFHLSPVQLGVVANGLAEIKSGATVGDRVVVSGAYGLTDGTNVTAIDSPSNSAAEQHGY